MSNDRFTSQYSQLAADPSSELSERGDAEAGASSLVPPERAQKGSESGQGTTEYALILSFVAVAAITAAMLFGANLASYLGWIAAQA